MAVTSRHGECFIKGNGFPAYDADSVDFAKVPGQRHSLFPTRNSHGWKQKGPPMIAPTGSWIRLALTVILLCVLVTSPGWAEPMAIILTNPSIDGIGTSGFHNEPSRPITLIRVGPRLGLSGRSPFGRDQREYFQQYDVVALFGLPWGWQERTSGTKFDMRLLSSAGQLAAAEDTGLMVTVVPCLAISSPNDTISVDLGGGAAFFSNYRYGSQDFGGPAQIVGTGGIGLNLIPGFYAGYRFQHFSDAGAYGPSSLGVDMHMLEMNYRF